LSFNEYGPLKEEKIINQYHQCRMSAPDIKLEIIASSSESASPHRTLAIMVRHFILYLALAHSAIDLPVNLFILSVQDILCLLFYTALYSFL
jgi:hypothetical protein